MHIRFVRLLDVDDTRMPELRVTYLAETDDAVPAGRLAPSRIELDAQALRLPYAELGGPVAELAWAEAALTERGYGPLVANEQIRTWNLSSIWRLEADGETFWLKLVPPFFAHEPRVLALFANERVPRLLASEGNRMLLQNILGEDCYRADREQMLHMVDLQWRWHDRVDALLSIGLPDIRGPVLSRDIARVASLYLSQFDADKQTTIASFLDALPDRLARLDDCGLPATLVHGDFHPGNWRGMGLDLTMLDWGDCVIEHPLLDLRSLLDGAGEHRAAVLTHWTSAWQERLPDAEVATAVELIRPIAYARGAVVFQDFLDQTEPSEQIYHDSDSLYFLNKVASMLR
jgi:hypothetical protein